MKKARIVIGANFGDEGKGVMTDYLCSQGAGMVVRFNGGAQAGHTVVTPSGDRHVFHHFGSGSMLGVPTFLSQFFVCNPILFFAELKQLNELGLKPRVYAHPSCLITTFADMVINQRMEEAREARGVSRHGSCGIGFHETINRSEVDELCITMGDLWSGGDRLLDQMEQICYRYATFRTGKRVDADEAVSAFIKCCHEFANHVEPLGIAQCEDPVFEGAQGLLLDQDNKEFFPHVTHSSTGMKNVRTLCAQAGITDMDVYYVSRTYLTRHGHGPLPGEDASMSFHDSTNKPNKFQGDLRFAKLNTGSLMSRCSKDAEGRFSLALTHCDQVCAELDADLYFNGPSRNHASKADPAGVAITA